MFLAELDQGASWQISALEEGLKKAMLSDARALLEWMVNEASARQSPPGSRGTRSRRIETVLGPIEIRRAYCLQDGHRHFPLDDQLGLVDSYTPGLMRLMVHAGAMEASFEQAEETLRMYAGLSIVGKQIQRITHHMGPKVHAWNREHASCTGPAAEIMYVCCDGTGVPMRATETAGRKGRGVDGKAKTREVKLGCIFTQLGTDTQGQPLREPSSTTYCATFDGAVQLGPLLREQARQRGLGRARASVFIGDGAAWIWKLADTHFPSATQILDFYHACEHLHQLASILWPRDSDAAQRAQRWKKALYTGRVDSVIKQAQAALPHHGPRRKKASVEIAYLRSNAKRMRYAQFRKQGYFIGSGVVEAGCKTLVAQRMKHSGMHWTIPGAESVIATRCCVLNNLYDQFWEHHNHSRTAA